ncbi:leucine-rich repeat domain-containing protein, partial [Butyricicoccus sp. 1XD8-22]
MSKKKTSKATKTGLATLMLASAVVPTIVVGVDTVKAEESNPVSDFTYTTASDGGIKITGYQGSSTQLVIPSEIEGLPVTSIGVNAFLEKPISKVIFPSTLKVVETNAFSGTQLQQVVMNEGLEEIGRRAFSGTLLTEVYIPS